ncbi:MAG: hypothetical protein HY606_00835, partial [Planctomycetes bacterium]|nr:hypothetical protein [Planctomycetota bacterium]
KNNPDQAIIDIKTAIKMQPDNYYFFLVEGHIYEIKKDYSNAISSYKRSFSLNNSNFDTRLSLGRTLTLTKQYNKAVTYLKQAEEIDPSHIQIHYYLSVCYQETNNPDLAKKHREIYEELKNAQQN